MDQNSEGQMDNNLETVIDEDPKNYSSPKNIRDTIIAYLRANDEMDLTILARVTSNKRGKVADLICKRNKINKSIESHLDATFFTDASKSAKQNFIPKMKQEKTGSSQLNLDQLEVSFLKCPILSLVLF